MTDQQEKEGAFLGRRRVLQQLFGGVIGCVSASTFLSGCLGTGTPDSMVTDPTVDDVGSTSGASSFTAASLEESGFPSSTSLGLYCCTQDSMTHSHQVAWQSAAFTATASYSGFSGLGVDQLGSVAKLKALAALGASVSVLVSSPGGSATHCHQLVLTPDQLLSLAEGKYVRARTSNAIGTGHEHTVVLALPRAAEIA